MTVQDPKSNVPALAPPRLPYHPAIEERFGIDKASWKALVEAIFPLAQSVDSIIMVLSYCRARKLDVFKRNVHIVPIWDSNRGRMVDTVWPGIGELRTTAIRTRQYAGRDDTAFGPLVEQTWIHRDKKGAETAITVQFHEWAQVTVYRIVGGNRVAFRGPRVYWRETYARAGRNSDAPNSMWQQRPIGQHEKCAEAAALRAAFPEELGDEFAAEESRLIQDVHTVENARAVEAEEAEQPKKIAPKGLDDLTESLRGSVESDDANPTAEETESEDTTGDTPLSPSESFWDDAAVGQVEPEPGP